MPDLERHDLQGLIARGYGRHDAARFLLLTSENAAAARLWLGSLISEVTDGDRRPGAHALNVAFTYAGLRALGLGDEALATFAPEFREGMTTPHRRRILGDHGASAPESWAWGGPETAPVHVLLLLYGRDRQALDALHLSLAPGFEEGGLIPAAAALETAMLATPQGWRVEHFGFRDGLSQPVIPELKPVGDPNNHVPAGEFVLGYSNAYGLLTERPLADAGSDPEGHLPPFHGAGGRRDLGGNGTYLVFRQLGQDVAAFWRYMREAAGSEAAAVHLAAKMVGRWPSGAPLVRAPEHDQAELGDDNSFGYHHEDPHGYGCPLGAHVRRTHTRDALDPSPGTERSYAVSNRHRLLRRGRPYGPPLAPSLEVADLMGAPDDGAERGLHFICCCANIARQFEFVQHTWANNPKFGGLYSDVDPIVGDRNPYGAGAAVTFTQQAEPVRRRYRDLPPFVTVRGGAYFFLPGMRALRYLAALPIRAQANTSSPVGSTRASPFIR